MSAVAMALGLTVAAVYGTSDFAGGVATKRVSALWVLAVSQAVGLAVGLLAVAFDTSASLSTSALVRGVVGGTVGVVGVGLLYTALAGGTMGVVAPVTGVTSALVPVAWGLVQGEHPSAVALVGVALALGAVALAASPARAATDQPSARATGVPLAFAAGLCFGTILVLLSDVDPADGMWPLVAWRCVSMSLAVAAVVLVRPRPRPNRPAVGLAAITGVLEMVANGVYILAAREGLLSLVGVLGSLYPISTVLLARFLLHERLDRRQELGLVCALGGLSLIAAG